MTTASEPPAALDPRDSHIAALEAQCAALQAELAQLRKRVDPNIAVVPPERSGGGNALLEIFWKTAKEEFSPAKSLITWLPLGGLVTTRYLELPAQPAAQLRIDPGAGPGVFTLFGITLHNLTEEGVLIQPALATWDPQNKYYGMTVAGTAMVLAEDPALKLPLKIISWGNDPQLIFNLPQEAKIRPRILGITAAVLDPAHAMMAQYGQQMFDYFAHEWNKIREAQKQIEKGNA